MDEREREQHSEYVEDAENLREEHRDEELREASKIYPDDVDSFTEEQGHEEVREAREVYSDDEDTFMEERRHEEVRTPRPAAMEKGLVPLLDEREADEFRSLWQDIQTEFVDDPQSSVEKADELVTKVINSITENFASERTSLEDQWNRGEEASTEDLRLAIKRYRSFFNRLLTLEASETPE